MASPTWAGHLLQVRHEICRTCRACLDKRGPGRRNRRRRRCRWWGWKAFPSPSLQRCGDTFHDHSEGSRFLYGLRIGEKLFNGSFVFSALKPPKALTDWGVRPMWSKREFCRHDGRDFFLNFRLPRVWRGRGPLGSNGPH